MADTRARSTTVLAVNTEQLTKLLNAAVSVSGDPTAVGELKIVVAEAPVTQAQLDAVLATYIYDASYTLVGDPVYVAAHPGYGVAPPTPAPPVFAPHTVKAIPVPPAVSVVLAGQYMGDAAGLVSWVISKGGNGYVNSAPAPVIQTGGGPVQMNIGEWVVKNGVTFSVVLDADFRAAYAVVT